jgi:hypothetical protein
MMWVVLLQSDHAEIYFVGSCEYVFVYLFPKLQWQIEQTTPAVALPFRFVDAERLCVEQNKLMATGRACGGLRSLTA